MKKEMNLLVDIKNVQSKQLNFEHGFRPIYYFSRFAGLWPFSVRPNLNGTNQKVYVSLIDGLWFTVAFCLYLSFAFIAYERLKAGIEGKGKDPFQFRIVIYDVLQTSSLLFGAIGIVLDMINRKKLFNVLEKFIQFDNEVS